MYVPYRCGSDDVFQVQNHLQAETAAPAEASSA